MAGVYAGLDFYWDIGDKFPLAKQFVDKFEAKYGQKPEWGAEAGYMQIALWADAVEMMRTILGAHGAEVRGAESAEAGLEAVRTWRPDVLVSDIAMPGQDGFWLVEQVRSLPESQGGSTPAIALTAFADREDRARALAAGFQRHLRKPVSADELAATIAALAGCASRPPGAP